MIDSVRTNDGVALHVQHWPVADPRGVVVLVHGMAEHIERYQALAAVLNEGGFAVVGHDQRGHGRTAASEAELGFISESHGWQHLVDDVRTVADAAQLEHPDVPVLLVSHSMGSLVSRCVVQEDRRFAGLLLCGTPSNPGPLRLAGQAVAAGEARLRGTRSRSDLLDQLTFGTYNRAIPNPRTKSDWLSRDAAQVDAYIADPFCGWVGTTSFFGDLLEGVGRAHDPRHIARTRHDLPVMFLSGDADPAGGRYGSGVTAAARAMRRRVDRVDVRLYARARHELFHETNADEVFADVLRWCTALT